MNDFKTNAFGKRMSSVILINLALALVALGKDILLASYLGTTSFADAFVVAYFIVDTIGNNLVAISLGVAVIPVLAKLHTAQQHQRFTKITRYLVGYTLVISLILALLILVIKFGLVTWVGNGLDSSTQQLSVALLTLLVPTIVLYPLINIGMSINQVYNRFNIPALAPVLFNLVFFIGLIYLIKLRIPLINGVYDLTLFIGSGVLIMLIIVWLPIFKNGLTVWRNNNRKFSILIRKPTDVKKQKSKFRSSELLDIWRSFLPYLLTSLFPQIVFMVEKYLGSHLEEGTISGLSYAFRLVQFPIWVFIAGVSAVLFPLMAKLAAIGDKQGFNEELKNSIYLTSMVTIPFTILLYTLRVPIITILLQRGAFDAHSVSITATIMAGYSLTIIWQGFSVIWIKASLVEGKVSYALFAAALGAFTTIGFDMIFVKLAGAATLGYGAAIGAVINFVALYMLLSHFSKLHFSPWKGLFRIVLANGPLLIVLILLSQLWENVFVNGSRVMDLGYVLLAMVVCITVYWISLRIFKVVIVHE